VKETMELEEIRAVIAGKSASTSRPQAMALLLASDSPDRERDFERILAAEAEPIGLRLLAASHLGRIATPASEEILITHANIPVESLRRVIVLALAWIGGERALRALADARGAGTAPPGPEAEFAALVIAHRLGSVSPVPSPSSDETLLELADAAGRPIHVRSVDRADADFVLRCLAREPLGVDLDGRSVHEIRCGRRRQLLVLNRDLAGPGAVQRLARRPNILGVLARLNQETGLYYPAHLVLTSPETAPEFSIAIHRLTGTAMFRGAGHVEDDRALFRLRAVAQPGAMAVRVEGVLTAGTVRLMKAFAAVSANAKRAVMTAAK
jgi:hypothetical protein